MPVALSRELKAPFASFDFLKPLFGSKEEKKRKYYSGKKKVVLGLERRNKNVILSET